MRLSAVGQADPVMTAAILDATLPKTELTKNPVKLGGGPDVGSLMLLGVGLFVVYIFTSSTPPAGGTIRGY